LIGANGTFQVAGLPTLTVDPLPTLEFDGKLGGLGAMIAGH